MAEDPNSVLRAELEAALAVLDPQLRGLHDLVAVSISPPLIAQINAQIVDRQRRRGLIQAVLDDMDKVNDDIGALEADGYPALPNAPLDNSLFSELQGQSSDLDAAAGVFEAEKATGIAVSLGDPTNKPT